ncbi:hypothetical protein [Neobacillus sp. 204]|uniref:hypothetical protein n=1 Tax=Neobacillus sp. 204 TaxID=3383351 RepID=UPI00397C3312
MIKGVQMSVTLSSRLLLVPILIRKDKKHYIIEDQAAGEFFEMPEVCVDAIHLINNGESLEVIERHLREKYPNEEVDLIHFAEQLLALNLIAEIDGEKVFSKENNKENLGFLWISPKIGRFFFNKVALFFYAGLFILNLILLLSNPSLVPRYKDLFIFDFMVFNIPAWLVLTFCLVLIHEFGHILAIRAQNLPTNLGVGHRLFLVVLETDMSSVWKLPSKDRNVLFLAGICFDTVILSLALISQLALSDGSGIFQGIMNIIVLDIFIRLVYQLCVYMKTDLYHVFENISGCYNLMENAQYLIFKRVRFVRSNVSEDDIFPGERKTVFLYSIFYFVGVFLTLSLYAIYYIPQLGFAFKKVLPGFLEGPATFSFWDALLFSLQITLGFGLLIFSWRKKYLRG